MIRSIIVDDEPKSRNLLVRSLKDFCPKVDVVGTAESVDTASKLIEKLKPDLVFLDIEMPEKSGLHLLENNSNHKFHSIIISAYERYAVNAIKHQVLDYLLKPLNIDELVNAVNKVPPKAVAITESDKLLQLIEKFPASSEKKHKPIAIQTTNGQDFIFIQHIMYCQADGNCTWFYLNNGQKLISSKNLGTYEKILPQNYEQDEHCFYRVHHSALVNLHYITRFNNKENYVIMKNGTQINVAQRRKSTFQRILRQSCIT